MRRPGAVLLVVMIAVATLASGHAQQTPIFRATADLVQIDVSVLDRDRQPVRSLDQNLLIDDLGRTFAAMQRANLNVYQFGPRGLEVARKVSEDFGVLAENTGGRAFTNTNAPWEGVPQVFRENSSHYLLGFGRPAGRRTAASARSLCRFHLAAAA
jgi:hypothetical protein